MLLSGVAAADATLSNPDSPHRSPGSFWVTFKSPRQLSAIPRSQLASLTVLPGVLPDSETNLRRLANALTQRIGATVQGIAWSPDQPSIWIEKASNDAIVNILAKDPRIESIGANIMALPVEGRRSESVPYH
jgi:hypothetical protein